MSEIKKIKERFAIIEKKISKRQHSLKSLQTELEDIRKQILNAVYGANKQEREELDDLLTYINFIKTKFGSQLF